MSPYRPAPLLLALSALFATAPTVLAAPQYHFRLAALGVESPLIAPGLGTFSIAPQSAGTTFRLAPPSSTSDGAFSYTSSDLSVATISGDVVTVLAEGSTTITATQGATQQFTAASANAVLSVSRALPSNFVTSGGLVWSFPQGPMNHRKAAAYCATTINGQAGWRIPTHLELADLYNDRVQAGYLSKGWPVRNNAEPYGLMRGSIVDPSAGPGVYRKSFRLGLGSPVSVPDSNAVYEGYVTCVR